MEKELILGIDYGGKYTGLAVVDQRNNQVLYARTIKMRDDVTDILEGRREQRGIRRTAQTKKNRLRELKNYLRSIGYDESTETFKTVYNLAHKRGYDYADMPEKKTPEEIEAMDTDERKQYEEEWAEWKKTERSSRHRKEVLQDVRKVMADGGATEDQIKRVESIFNKQYRPRRFNNRILTKCKVCGKNTPLRKNVRKLLLENVVRFLPLQNIDRETLKSTILEGKQEKVNEMFKKFRKDYKITLNQKDWPGKNLIDIAYNRLPGRLPFCKEHFPENEKYTTIEKKTFRLAPSLKAKIANVLDVIKKEILPEFPFSKVVMESNNFDIAAKTKGRKQLAKDEYSRGYRKSGETLKEALLKETDGRCIYCGKEITLAETTEDHIYPKKAGGINIFANLVASCKTCNEKKRGRTPLESGVMPNSKVVASIKNDLKLKILKDAKSINQLDFNKYMSLASIGWRHMRDELRRLIGNKELPIERQSGITTAHFRKWWGFKKERGNDRHHAIDAIILAARKDTTDEGLVDMTLKPRYTDGSEFDPEKHISESIKFKRSKDTRGSALHDREPLSIKDGMITRRWMVTEIERGKEDTVISPEWREKLKEAFERFNISKGKCLDDNQAREAGFIIKKNGNVMSLRCEVKGLGWDQIVKIKNNAFKSNVHNVDVAVWLDDRSKKRATIRKNPRLIKYFDKPQEQINGRILFTLKRGDLVKYEGEDTIYRIKKLGESLVLDVVVSGSKIRNSASAVRLEKIVNQNLPLNKMS